MTKKGRLLRIMTRALCRVDSHIYGKTFSEAYRNAKFHLYMNVINIKNSHRCQDQYDKRIGIKRKVIKRASFKYSGGKEKIRDCPGCQGFEILPYFRKEHRIHGKK